MQQINFNFQRIFLSKQILGFCKMGHISTIYCAANVVTRSDCGLNTMVNRRNWQELPSEITTSILGRLGAVDILVSARKVCRSWRGICSDPAMWRIVDLMITTEPDHDFRYRLEILARKAVDLSGGEMIDITLHHFLRYNTLFYIADRYIIMSFKFLSFLLYTHAMLFSQISHFDTKFYFSYKFVVWLNSELSHSHFLFTRYIWQTQFDVRKT